MMIIIGLCCKYDCESLQLCGVILLLADQMKKSSTADVRYRRGSTTAATRRRLSPSGSSGDTEERILVSTSVRGVPSLTFNELSSKNNRHRSNRRLLKPVGNQNHSGKRWSICSTLWRQHQTYILQDFNNYFTGKDDSIRATTASAPVSDISHRDVKLTAGFGVVSVGGISHATWNAK